MNKIERLGSYDLISGHSCIHLDDWDDLDGNDTIVNLLTEEICKEIEGKEFTISVCYPFDKELSKKIKLDLYCSLDGKGVYAVFVNPIIDAIVEMLREMYKTTEGTEYQIGGLLNLCSKSPIYGDCMHAITDLWIEYLIIDLKSHTIIPYIGS